MTPVITLVTRISVSNLPLSFGGLFMLFGEAAAKHGRPLDDFCTKPQREGAIQQLYEGLNEAYANRKLVSQYQVMRIYHFNGEKKEIVAFRVEIPFNEYYKNYFADSAILKARVILPPELLENPGFFTRQWWENQR